MLTADLLAQTAVLVDVPSVSHSEAKLADLVESELRSAPYLEVARIGDNVIGRTAFGRSQRVVLGGHLDTVPPKDNSHAVLESDRCFGVGSADMKGGLAVLLDIARSLRSPRYDLTFVMYACEEVERVHSGLAVVDKADRSLLMGDAAILLEPTNARVEAGCQGVVRFEATVRGVRAHSARPWVGRNAIHRLAPLLERAASFEERTPVIDGCEYHESLQAVRVSGGVAGNVIPDEATVALSHRFAPDRDTAAAWRAICSYFESVLDAELGDELKVTDMAPSAPPGLSHDVLAALVRASGQDPVAKIGWTDVAWFAERNIPATNFGPGDPLLAHSPGEYVTRADLERVRAALGEILGVD